MYLYIVFHINSVFIHYFPYFTRQKNKNNLREFEPQNSKQFKNIQAEFKNLVSYKKKKCINKIGQSIKKLSIFQNEHNDNNNNDDTHPPSLVTAFIG